MSEQDGKSKIPAYVSYKTFSNFINGLAESGVPAQIDKSMMSAMSGSAQSAMLGALEFLGLVDSKGIPGADLQQLVDSKESIRGPLLRSVLERSYQFLFSGSIDLKRATTKQVEEAFRNQGISGSTVVKCIAFFLAAAKAASIQISPHVKTPPLIRNSGGKRVAAQGAEERTQGLSEDDEDEEVEGTRRLKLPLLGKRDVVLIVPADFNAEDWKFLKPIFEAYMTRLIAETGAE